MSAKTIMITGGSKGMGKYMAKRFAEEGYNVVITGRSKEALESTKQEFANLKGEILPISMDVRNIDDVKRTVTETLEHFPSIDYLINNAAGNFICPAENLSVNGWNSVINIVLNGTFYCSSEVGKYWINNGIKGSIVNIVATYTTNGGPGVVHSASAKAGVLAMTKTLAVEWGRKYGIRVNAIAPGPIERTGGAEKLVLHPEEAEIIRKRIPLNRFGTPEEVADLAYYLLVQNTFINGECVVIDGGHSLNQYPF